MKYSIILPVYNELESISMLWLRLKSVMGGLNNTYEAIFIDDGSDLETGDILDNIKSRFSNVVVYRFKKNMGQTEALRKGFEMASGEIVITMDSDLQDDPKYIPKFINKINEGYDMVCGYRKRRKDKMSKIVLSKIGNFIQKVVWKTGINDLACTFRAYKRDCINYINLSKRGYHRYIPYFLLRKGFKITEIEIEQNKRAHFKSRYSALKAFDVVREFISINLRREK